MKIKGLQLTDLLIAVLIIAVIAVDVDFANMQIIDYVLLGAFGFWLITLAVRLYIANKE